jgi:hypothetical protein
MFLLRCPSPSAGSTTTNGDSPTHRRTSRSPSATSSINYPAIGGGVDLFPIPEEANRPSSVIKEEGAKNNNNNLLSALSESSVLLVRRLSKAFFQAQSQQKVGQFSKAGKGRNIKI